ncbi:MerR family transcriptional regulator [soil metagenome]
MADPRQSHLSIGEVLSLLLEEFPDVTISKIRFLESQGLIAPERTASGYRKFFPADVELLRLILRQQREHFLPLRVIKDRIDSGEIDSTPPAGFGRSDLAPGDSAERLHSDEQPTSAMVAKHPASGRSGGVGGGVPTSRSSATDQLAPTPPSMPRLLPGVLVNRDELCAMASVTREQLATLEEYGVVAKRPGGTDLYGDDAVEIAAAAAGFLQVGIDARHLRAWRTSVDREVGLFEQLVVPLLRQRHPEARSQAVEELDRLNGLGARLRGALMREAVRRHLEL